MDISAAGWRPTLPWLVLGVVAGVALVLLAGLADRPAAAPADRSPPPDAGAGRVPGRRPARLPGVPARRGTGGRRLPAGRCSRRSRHPPVAAPPRHRRRDALVVLGGDGRHGAAAGRGWSLRSPARAARTTGARPPRPASAAPARGGRRPAHLRRRGPRAARGRRHRHLPGRRGHRPTATGPGRGSEFPTFNCLTAEAPADPVAAGCTPTLTEYAELASPDLAVADDGRRPACSRGRFPTETRPNGSPPAPTGPGLRAADRGHSRRARRPTDGWRPAARRAGAGPGTAPRRSTSRESACCGPAPEPRHRRPVAGRVR